MAQAVAKLTDGDVGVGYLAYGNAGISDAAVGSYGALASVDMAPRTYFNASFLLSYSKGDDSETSIAIVELSIKKASTTSVRPKIYLLNEVVKNKVDLVVTYDSANNICYIYCQNKVKEWAGVRLVPLYAGSYGNEGNTYKAITFYHGNFSATKLGTDVTTIVYNTKDASWINSGTFDAARIPTSLPNATAGYADKIKSNGLGSGVQRFAFMPDNNAGYKDIHSLSHCWMYQVVEEGTTLAVGNNGGNKTVERRGTIAVGNGQYSGLLRSGNITANRLFQFPDVEGTLLAAADLGTSGQYLKSNGANNAPSWDDASNLTAGVAVNLPYGSKSFQNTTGSYIIASVVPPSNDWQSHEANFEAFIAKDQNDLGIRCKITMKVRNTSNNTYSWQARIDWDRENSYPIQLSVKRDDANIYLIASCNTSEKYCGVTAFLKTATGYDGLVGDTIPTWIGLYPNSTTQSQQYYVDVSLTSNKVGDTSTPVYVDTDGSVKPCEHITKSYSGSVTLNSSTTSLIRSLSGYDLKLTLSSGQVLVQLKRSTGSVTAKVSRVWHGQTHTGDNEAVHVLNYQSISVGTSYVTIDGDCPTTTSSYPKDVHGNGIVSLSDGGSIEYNIGTYAAAGISSTDVVYIIKQS